MYSKLKKTVYIFLIFSFFSFISPSLIKACTYESTITGNHLDLKITSDISNIQIVQLMYFQDGANAQYTITALYGPSSGWTQYADGSQTYGGKSMVIQNRKQNASAAYWVDWIDYTHYRIIPAGIYGLDFTGSMTYNDISVEYGTMDENGNFNVSGNDWKFCTRTGNLSSPPSPTPSPVSKVFFIPGFGASWNGSAFANCQPDSNPEHWTLASYAESIYSPILTALSESGWETIPFYYDWRQQIPSNSTILSNKINITTAADEKVNLVGHSMGGLVAADYLINHDQGIKTNSLLAVGSPLKGAPQAYPAWAGGDIWEDNFITKVAMNLYLLHCGSLISGNRAVIQSQVPSVRNLLPVFDYLKSGNRFESWNLMAEQNDWLPLTLDPNFWGVKFGTLTGSGFSTLSQIQVKNPSKKDLLFDNQIWLDGKPGRKIYSTDGDGTVLLSSGKYDDSHNVTINQTHSDLVGSVAGMAEILKFLNPNLSWPASTAFSEPNSALIIIGYPSNFWVTDEKGNTKKDGDGMTAFVNPKSGNYKLNLIPKSNNTLVIVAQFLPNGDVKYKEYDLKGFNPKSKTINFDLQNPVEDPLN